MAIDYSGFSTEDLEAISRGNYAAVSTAGLENIERQTKQIPATPTPSLWDSVVSSAKKAVSAVEATINPAAAVQKLTGPTGQAITEHLPEIGATAGMASGVAGSALGAAGGQALKEAAQAATGAEGTPQSALSAGGQPILQGGLQVAGAKAAPIISKTLAKGAEFAGSVGDWLASKIGKSFIKAAKKEVAYGADPAKAIVDEGIVAHSWDNLVEKIGEAKAKLGAEYENLFSGLGDKPVDLGNISEPVSDMLKKANRFPQKNATLINSLTGLKEDLAQYQGKEMTATSALELKKDLSAITKYTGASGDEMLTNKAQQEVAAKIGNAIEEAIPEVKPLNVRYQNLTALENAAVNRNIVASRHSLVGLPEMFALGAAAAGHYPAAAAIELGGRALQTPLGATTTMRALTSGAVGKAVSGVNAAIESPARAYAISAGARLRTDKVEDKE